jgi:hypothetical protein
MNDANYALLNYLTDVYGIKDITHESNRDDSDSDAELREQQASIDEILR